MASTYSPSLKITLMGDGDQSGLWGQTTNTNLGTLIEQAITGVVSITMFDANYTLTSFNGITDEARNAVLVVTGTNNAVRDLIPPVVEKLYTVVNNTTGGYAIRVIGASGTGVNIPNGATCLVYCDGTNFINGLSGTSGNFSVAGALLVTSTANLGGAITYGGVTLSNAVTGTGNMVLSASPTFTGAPISTTASPGTNTTQIATTAFVNAAVVAATGSLGTMSTQNANNVTITGGTITGITDLAVADGGTGRSTLAANAVLVGNGTSGINSVAPSTSGNFLVSNGTAWTSTTLAASGVKLGLGITGEVWSDVNNGTYNVNQNYTNSLSYPIAMTVEWSNGNKSFTVNGVPNASASGAGGNTQTSMFIIIPAGAVWQLVSAGGGINRWTQLS
jgi:hypothetical protein